ncbi:hypothetical protein [Salinibacterium sp.]|uniref:hypothetical protein n=1 Tax=Salinibacterium sp. TaxID=1915057 RepID=UPI00286A7335|nr:hypothetical protein [Salinibacterium sp.]
METWKLEISFDELRAAMSAVLDHLEAASGATLEISEDYFWSATATAGAEFDPSRIPEPTIGQYSETWNNLARERQGNRDSTIDYSAVWLGQILSGVGLTRL